MQRVPQLAVFAFCRKVNSQTCYESADGKEGGRQEVFKFLQVVSGL